MQLTDIFTTTKNKILERQNNKVYLYFSFGMSSSILKVEVFLQSSLCGDYPEGRMAVYNEVIT